MTNITEEHRRIFAVLTSGPPGRYCLFSCDAEPAAAAIASVTVWPPEDDGGEAGYVISPLFILITDDTVLTDHDGREA